MDIEELIALLQNPGDEGVAPTVYDDLRAFHTGEVGTRDARLAELEEAAAQLQAKNQELVNHNYELMMQLGNTNDETTVEGEDGLANDEDEEDQGISSLFTSDKGDD